ncbi:MAG: carbohydrate ABC transporter permease, partial [Actinomycetia bacterium]|nr:carbohydrate ABC transporter permease [Actinomycetes bacterium]
MKGLTTGVQRKTFLRGRRWPYHLGLIVTTVVIAFPMLYAMLVATQTNPETYAIQLTPGSALRENFQTVWFDRDFAGAMMNSFQQAILVTVGKTVLSLLAGLAFVYFKFRFKWLVFFLVLITLMMPTEVMILAMFRQ